MGNNYTYVINNKGEVILVKKDTYTNYVDTMEEKEQEYQKAVDSLWGTKKEEES